VDELCARYDNEDVHTEHVTALALRLFDLTRTRLELPASDRALLEAACRLHDIGYSANPRRHADVSAEIVLREGLRGFRDTQCAYIAAAIPFHSGKRKPNHPHPFLEQVNDPQRALRLAAFLRVADGLDHCHLQDTAIVGVKHFKRAIRINVRCAHFPYNVVIANQKTDLWRACFPVELQIKLLTTSKAARQSLVVPGLSVREAARRLLLLYFRTVLKNVDGAIEGEDSEPLHDVRVAIRRFRTVLRAFRKPLAGTSAEQIDQDLKRLNDALGPARDVDVWVDFLTSEAVRKQMADNRRWEKFVAHQQSLQRLQLVTVGRHLGGAAFGRLRLRIGRFLRTELPRAIRNQPPGSLEKLARSSLRKALRRASKLARLRHSPSPEDLHRLRIAFRRVRYLGGFFASVLGPPFNKLTRRVHDVEQTLGRIHDADVSLARVLREGPSPPRLLVRDLEQRRAQAVTQLAAAWRRMKQPALQREVRRRLK
jgi:CHAD domain-containing protein